MTWELVDPVYINITTIFPMWDIAIFHENAGFNKNIFVFAAVGQTDYQIKKIYIYFKIKNPLESISALFLKISLLEPEILKVKEWFQVKVPTPLRFRSSLIAVYAPYPNYWKYLSLYLLMVIRFFKKKKNFNIFLVKDFYIF